MPYRQSVRLPVVYLPTLPSIIRFLLLIFLFILSPSLALAQVLRGRVVDAERPETPLVGAAIRGQGAVTDSAGYFAVQLGQPVSYIQVSHLGYRTQRVPITTETPTTLTVALEATTIQVLDEVTVSSKYYRQYATNTISSALRLRTPLINLSQNIQTITPEQIFDQGSFNMTDNVSRNISGVIRQEVSNNLGPYLFMRGGQIAALRNGVDLAPIYRGPQPEDASIIDRVEFVKGPSLFMNNIGDPAGSFNVVTKQPTGAPRRTLTAMFGSFDFYRLAADFDGQLDKKGKLLYRLNAMGMGMSTNSFVKFDYNRRFLIAPVLRYHVSGRTYVSAEYTYQQFRYGLSSPIVDSPGVDSPGVDSPGVDSPGVDSPGGFGSLPVDFAIAEPSLNPYHVSDHTGFLTFSHQFNSNWQLTIRGAFMRNDNEGAYMWVTGVNTAAPTILLRNPKYDLNRTDVFSQQAFVNGSVVTGTIRHQVLAGTDLNQKRFRADSYVQYDTYVDAGGKTQLKYYPLDVNNPVYGAEIPNYHIPGGLINRGFSSWVISIFRSWSFT
ncbi:TonB-dependent receptor-like protein [Spirosoma oryzae]|uniref:TonB-dependent receptor-like protein n=2 Tax=Spirosoma oryzae TaxID=1469603 RepID=A0A2T0SAF8_9BACT|nr:TonB-dependent receptor-like protein [Spirosoma oryzae]